MPRKKPDGNNPEVYQSKLSLLTTKFSAALDEIDRELVVVNAHKAKLDRRRAQLVDKIEAIIGKAEGAIDSLVTPKQKKARTPRAAAPAPAPAPQQAARPPARPVPQPYVPRTAPTTGARTSIAPQPAPAPAPAPDATRPPS